MINLGGSYLSADDVRDLLVTDHPMVREFRFVKEEESEFAIKFVLQIFLKPGVKYQQQRDKEGKRIEPVWKTTTGKEQIGQGIRTISLEGYEIVAQNSRFFPDQEYNDLGIGSAMYVAMERMYRAIGIDKCRLHAVDIGRYAWARQGFAFLESGIAKTMERPFMDFLDKNDCAYWKPVHYSWDYANYDWEDRRLDEYKVGKYYMLNHFNTWFGIKHLSNDMQAGIAENSRKEVFAKLPDKIDGASPELAVR